jgi:AraC family transcriptional regulator
MDAGAVPFEQRIDRVIDGFVQQASRRPTGSEIATRAAYSVAQTHRIFHKSYGESPGAFRRRLVLERAADMISRTRDPIWKIALECGFASSEAFSRAFRKAFRLRPLEYRKSRSHGWLPSPNKVHYWRGSLLRSMDTGGKKMNIVDRLVEHDLTDSRRLIERAQTLTAKQLDAKLHDPQPRLFLECFKPTIRGRLDYLVSTKECWIAAVLARSNPMESGKRDISPKGLLARWTAAEAEWRQLVKDVESEGRWDEKFIDALCDTPETFSFGGMIAHVMDQSARQRTELFRAYSAIGHEDVCFGDPLTWEQRTA